MQSQQAIERRSHALPADQFSFPVLCCYHDCSCLCEHTWVCWIQIGSTGPLWFKWFLLVKAGTGIAADISVIVRVTFVSNLHQQLQPYVHLVQATYGGRRHCCTKMATAAEVHEHYLTSSIRSIITGHSS